MGEEEGGREEVGEGGSRRGRGGNGNSWKKNGMSARVIG